MKKNMLFAALTVATLSLAPVIHAQSGSDRVTAQDVKKETQALISTLKQYTADQRD